MLADDLWPIVAGGPPAASGPATMVDTSVYCDEARHLAELRIIRAHPLAAVHASEVAAPGDFVTCDLLGVPTLVVRGADGRVRAFRNACVHRGSPVETRPCGSARLLSCGFHGWSYDLDGTLRAVSSPQLFSSEPCLGPGLPELACEERHGIVWVTIEAPEAARGVRGWLGEDSTTSSPCSNSTIRSCTGRRISTSAATGSCSPTAFGAVSPQGAAPNDDRALLPGQHLRLPPLRSASQP